KTYSSTVEQDMMDAEMTCDVLALIQQHQRWTAQRPRYLTSPESYLYIQSSIIFFFTQFRQSYISDDVNKVVKVYSMLSERWGINTPNQFLDIILSSTIDNFRSSGDQDWRKCEEQLAVRTVKLLSTIAAG